MKEISVPDVVIYHANCADGAGAAAAISHFCESREASQPEFIPYGYEEDDPVKTGLIKKLEGKKVTLVDFSFKRAPMEALLGVCELLTLDHHESAARELAGLPGTVFDMSRSGAVMAWNYYFPGQAVPVFLQYIQDRDLWHHKLPFTKDVQAAIYQSMRLHAKNPARVLANFVEMISDLDEPHHFAFLAQAGSVLRANVELEIAEDLAKAKRVTIPGIPGTVILVESRRNVSELAAAMLAANPDISVAAVTSLLGVRTFYGLRSRKEDGVNVSLFAQQYGGGGHRSAAGFSSRNPVHTVIKSDRSTHQNPQK